MSDSFESLLENALSAPDLDLGHEMRRRLLAAAAPAVKEASENIVRFEVPDADAAAGFDWLVGDAPVTRPLIRRLSSDPGFFALLDDERRFLRSLRRSLRKPAAVVPKRRSPAVIAAAAAVVALVASTLSAFRGAGSATSPSIATAASGSPAVPASPSTPVTTHGGASPKGQFALFDDGAPIHRPLLGQSTAWAGLEEISDAWPARPSEVTSHAFSLEAAAAATFGAPDPDVAMLASSPEPSGVLLASNDASWSAADLIDSGFPAGPDLSFSSEEDRASVPEPGGMLPVMVGCLMLLLHRPKRAKSKG